MARDINHVSLLDNATLFQQKNHDANLPTISDIQQFSESSSQAESAEKAFFLSLPEAPIYDEPIGVLLKRGRLKRKYTQTQLAKITGIDNAEISRIEAGKTSKPKREILKKLCPYTGISYSEMLTRCGYNDTSPIQYFTDDGEEIDFMQIVKDLYSADIGLLQSLYHINRLCPEDIATIKNMIVLMRETSDIRSSINSKHPLSATLHATFSLITELLNSISGILKEHTSCL